jgi:hypothetical protein
VFEEEPEVKRETLDDLGVDGSIIFDKRDRTKNEAI